MTTSTVECPYCTTHIPARASRCPHCVGEIRTCPRCGVTGVNVQEKWKGALRGGRQIVVKCRGCRRVLEGSRW